MGRALRDGYRQNAFLMSKIDGRTKTAAASQISESLRRLQTDRIDLLQFHESAHFQAELPQQQVLEKIPGEAPGPEWQSTVADWAEAEGAQ